MWGCGLRPRPHIYPSPLLEGSFFSALINYRAEILASQISLIVGRPRCKADPCPLPLVGFVILLPSAADSAPHHLG